MVKKEVKKNVTITRYHEYILDTRGLNASMLLRGAILNEVSKNYPVIRHTGFVAKWLSNVNISSSEIIRDDKENELDECFSDVSSFLSLTEFKIDHTLFIDQDVRILINENGVSFEDCTLNFEDVNVKERIKNKILRLVWIKIFCGIVQNDNSHRITIVISNIREFYEKCLYIHHILSEGLK